MKNRVLGKLGVVLFVFALAATAYGAGSKRRPLNRSIYVPVAFKLCEHLTQGILYIGDMAVAPVPTERIFQFTYYPALHRFAPEVTQVRIQGTGSEGSPFLARLAVSPLEITSSNERIDLNMTKQLEKFDYKIDVRYKRIELLVRCDSSCGKRESGGGGTLISRKETSPLRFRYRE